MSGLIQPLKHVDTDSKDDAVLEDECDQHFAQHPVVQFLAELLTRLRVRAFPWWTPEQLRARWSATERMRWLAQRADLRQHTTTMLTGLAPRAGRQKDPEFQGQLVDSVIDCGDITALEFEDAFHPVVLAAYGPVLEYWRAFRESLPWEEDTPAHQELVAALIDELLAPRSTLRAVSRRPILTHWEVRTAIPSDIWNARIPLDVRAAIDDARMDRERARPDAPFRAVDDLAIATPSILAAHIPLRVLARVFDVAERSLGFSTAAPAPARAANGKSRAAASANGATVSAPIASPTMAPPAPPATMTPAGVVAPTPGSTVAPPPPPASARADAEPAPKTNGVSVPLPPPPRASADGTAKRAALRPEPPGAVAVPLPGVNGKGASKSAADAASAATPSNGGPSPAAVVAAAMRATGGSDDDHESKLER